MADTPQALAQCVRYRVHELVPLFKANKLAVPHEGCIKSRLQRPNTFVGVMSANAKVTPETQNALRVEADYYGAGKVGQDKGK